MSGSTIISTAATSSALSGTAPSIPASNWGAAWTTSARPRPSLTSPSQQGNNVSPSFLAPSDVATVGHDSQVDPTDGTSGVRLFTTRSVSKGIEGHPEVAVSKRSPAEGATTVASDGLAPPDDNQDDTPSVYVDDKQTIGSEAEQPRNGITIRNTTGGGDMRRGGGGGAVAELIVVGEEIAHSGWSKGAIIGVSVGVGVPVVGVVAAGVLACIV